MLIILVPGFPATEAETDCLPPVQNFVKAIASRNRDIAIHVVTFQYPFAARDYTWHGAMVHALGGRNKRFPIRLRTWFQAVRCVRRLMKAHRVVAFHSFWLGECTYVAQWLARMTGTKHVATICGQDALSDNPYLKRLRFNRMRITAGSEKASEEFFKNTGRRVDHIIPAGLDPEALAVRETTCERSIDILGVGSLIAIKDFSTFIGIVTVLSLDNRQLRCVIIGDGPERSSLTSKTEESGLQDIVKFVGHVPREEVLSTMRKAKILLHTSHYEGQGYVFLEALAAGMRVVCGDVGYTGNDTGVYRCKSTGEMTGVLKRLLTLPFEERKVQVESIDRTALAFEEIYGVR